MSIDLVPFEAELREASASHDRDDRLVVWRIGSEWSAAACKREPGPVNTSGWTSVIELTGDLHPLEIEAVIAMVETIGPTDDFKWDTAWQIYTNRLDLAKSNLESEFDELLEHFQLSYNFRLDKVFTATVSGNGRMLLAIYLDLEFIGDLDFHKISLENKLKALSSAQFEQLVLSSVF